MNAAHAGNFGAGLIANVWNPPGYNSFSNGLERGALGLAYHLAKNVAREFLPDVLHPGGAGPLQGTAHRSSRFPAHYRGPWTYRSPDGGVIASAQNPQRSSARMMVRSRRRR